jgi:hypothetical protein
MGRTARLVTASFIMIAALTLIGFGIDLSGAPQPRLGSFLLGGGVVGVLWALSLFFAQPQRAVGPEPPQLLPQQPSDRPVEASRLIAKTVTPDQPPPLERLVPRSSRPPDGSREFVAMTVADLMSMVDPNRTSAENARMTEAYRGKWMHLRGLVDDVMQSDRRTQITLQPQPGTRMIVLNFDETWADRVALLRQNTDIEVVGEIGSVYGYAVYFSHCEIVGVPTPPSLR